MSDPTATRPAPHRARWPWVLAAVVVAILVASAWLDIARTSNDFEPEGVLYYGAIAAFGAVGALICSRIPRQMIGRLFLMLAVGGAILTMSELWIIARPELPGREWSGLLNHLSIPISLGPLAFILLRFPDGELASTRWRWVERLAVVALFMLEVGALFSPTFTEYEGLRNPLGISAAGSFLDAVAVIGWLSYIPTVVAAGISQVFRFRRSRGEERERLKWFAFGGLLIAIGWILIMFSFDDTQTDVLSRSLTVPYLIGFLAFPILCGVAILRYRLFDIDVAIRRTVVFGALAAFITGVYVAIVVGLGALIGSGEEPTAVLEIAATVVVGLAFQPVRERVTRFANRLVYGERATPYEVMAALSRRVAETVSVAETLPEMARTSASGIGATAARVRLALPRGGRTVWWPDEGDRPVTEPDIAVAVHHGGEDIGEIAVWKPKGEPVTPGERALLEDLASQAGLTLHNVRLTEELAARAVDLAAQSEELRRSRERLVTARDVQRRRLERDIRDGPQRSLLGIAGALREVTVVLDRDPDEAVAVLDELGERAGSTLEGLRDIARGIFPPLLADKGIVAALEAHIRKVGANATIEAPEAFASARFDPEIETTVYFCCLQAIQNVMRHSGNALSVVRLEVDGGDLSFVVEDGGPGFDPASVPHGMGLQIMEDRVAALAGELFVTSAPGRGTRIAGRVPARALTGTQT